MYFSFKLMLREAKRNRLKIVIAIVVTLILFMSAFTLCNIASALPSNFYNYYEDFYPESIGVDIANADKDLYDNYDKYFIDYSATWDNVFKGGKLTNMAGDIVAVPSIIEETEDSIMHTSLLMAFIDPDVSEMFTSEMADVIINDGVGKVWTQTEEDGIWISDYVAGILNVTAGQSVKYVVNEKAFEININGVIDNGKYSSVMGTNLPLFLFMHESQAKEIIFASGMTFKMFGNVEKVDHIFAVYNELDDKYILSETSAMDMVAKVKNAEIICGIIGAIMLVGGLIILLNFISMFVSSNIKHIGVMRMLGAKTRYITLAYYMIFMIIVTIVCLVSWSVLPLYNFIVSTYCANIGYPFTIGINYGLVGGLFFVVYIAVTVIMLIKGYLMNRLSPNEIIKEDD